jgi:hypothetical protein
VKEESGLKDYMYLCSDSSEVRNEGRGCGS